MILKDPKWRKERKLNVAENSRCKLTLLFLNLKDVAPPSYDEVVKRQTGKASGSSGKEPGHKGEKEHLCDDDKTGQEDEAEDSSSCDEDDVWATEDEDNEDNDNESDSSEEEHNSSRVVGTMN